MFQQRAAAGVLLLLLVAVLQGVAGISILSCLSVLRGGQYLQNGDYYLLMQEDCNLVLYKGELLRGKQLWKSNTSRGGTGCTATLASTSQLQILNASGAILEHYGPDKTVNGNYFQLDSTGIVSIRVLGTEEALWYLKYPPLDDSALDVVWGPLKTTLDWSAMSGVLYMVAGYSLRPGVALQNGEYNFQLETSCQLTLQTKGAVKWKSGNGGSDCSLVLQETGILQILLRNGTVTWQSNSTGKGTTNSFVLYLSSKGELSVFDNLQLSTRVWTAGIWSGENLNLKLKNILAILAAGLVVAVVSIMVFWVVALYHGYCSGCVEPSVRDVGLPPETSSAKCRAFSLAEIRQATCSFKKELGRGGFGQVFYGQLSNGQQVAIKNLSAASSQGQREFLNEIQLLSMVHHKYLVSLLGYCTFGFPCVGWKKQLLVYEYMSGGDLHKRLHGEEASSNPLTWKQRTSIILQVAEGIEYLHHYCKPAIIHRDIKGSNVLLNETMTAKVADFGLSKLVAVEQDATHISTAVKGTFGYLDPEYYSSNRLTEKSDVYAFGVLLMEVLTGRSSHVKSEEDPFFIGYWVRDAWKSGVIDGLADPNLGGIYQQGEFSELVSLSLLCVKKRSVDRPSMIEVVQNLRGMGLFQSGPLHSMSKAVTGFYAVSAHFSGTNLSFSSSASVGTAEFSSNHDSPMDSHRLQEA